MESDKLKPNKDVISRRVGDEVVLVHLERDTMYSLNRTGARAWELLNEGLDLKATEAALADEFGVDRAEVRSELESLIAELEHEHLVEKV
jgi:Coenzyme PQQ synthesis protein D (PqqD)